MTMRFSVVDDIVCVVLDANVGTARRSRINFRWSTAPIHPPGQPNGDKLDRKLTVVKYREEGPFYQQPTPPRGDEVELMDSDAPSLLPMVCFQTIHGSANLTMLVERDWQRVSRRPDTRNSARSCTC